MAYSRIPEHVIDDILNRVDIVETVSGYIPLKRSGRNFRANCPFHQEKTPSFMVSADKQIYHCFGCGKGGNALGFIMEYEHMEFPEAVRLLANKCGVALPKEEVDPQSEGVATQLFKINELASIFYVNALNSSQGKAAKDYLLKRGIKEETIQKFKLGFALDSWDGLLNYLRSKNIPLSLIEKAGLIIAKQGGGYYDRFRNRIIFPIFDIKDRVIAFGARIMPGATSDQDLAKYVNSPETQIYVKGKHLFGLTLARESIRNLDHAVIVEGYLDFILPFQEGLQNIVASQGTALTIDQVRLLKRHTRDAVIIYDGDKAGEMATLRALDIFIDEGMNVKVVDLPKGLDPDTFVRKYGIKKLNEQIESAKNLFRYKLDILTSNFNNMDLEAKAKVSNEMLQSINRLKDDVLKSEYIKWLAEELSVKEEALILGMKKIKKAPDYSLAQASTKKAYAANPTEKLLIKLMLDESRLIGKLKDSLCPGDFNDARMGKIVSIMLELFTRGEEITSHSMMKHLPQEDLSGIICELMVSPQINEEDREKVVEDCIKRLKKDNLKTKTQRLQDEIKAAQRLKDEERLERLIKEFHQLTREVQCK